MTAGPNDLTTVAAVQAYLSLPGTLDADLIQSLVTAASAMIQSQLGYQIASGAYSETRNGNGKQVLALAYAPVTAITSVSVCGNILAASVTWGDGGYLFDANALYLTGCAAFDRGFRNIVLSYTAGYEAVPADLAQACVDLAAFRYKLISHSGLVSENMMQQSTSYSQKDMPSSVATAIEPYRRRFAIV